MLWKDLEPYVDSDQNQVIDAHLEFYRSAIALRRAHAALRVGGFRTLITDDSQDLWVFVREDAEEEILVALNASESDAQFDLPGEGWIPIFGETEATGTNALVSGVSGRAWARKK
jgi:glycosidase